MSSPGSIDLANLPEYETKLLLALSFFLGRDPSAQGRACLSMYLRQSEARIMAQVRYYAHQASRSTGKPCGEYDLLDLVAENPDQAIDLLGAILPVHTHSADVFGDDLDRA